MRSLGKAYASSLFLCLIMAVSGAQSEELEQANSGEARQVVVDPASKSVNISKGYFYVAPLGFMPSKVVVGQPNIVGVDVVGAQPFPHIHLIGLSKGATNLVVFDQTDKIQVAMRLSVSEEIEPKSAVGTGPEQLTAVASPAAAPAETDGAIYSIRVFRALAAEEINCSDKGCNLPKSGSGLK